MTGNASETRRVAIQGERGAFSEVAARAFFDHSIAIQSCPTFETLFAAVSSGQSHYGIAPVDNSLAGNIQPVWDLLRHATLPIVGEIELQVRHCLIGHEGVETTALTRVLSHAQALAQCQEFLNRLDSVEQVEVYDTAGAVKIVKESGESGAAQNVTGEEEWRWGPCPPQGPQEQGAVNGGLRRPPQTSLVLVANYL